MLHRSGYQTADVAQWHGEPVTAVMEGRRTQRRECAGARVARRRAHELCGHGGWGARCVLSGIAAYVATGGCTSVWATESSSARRWVLLVVIVVGIAALIAQPSRRSPCFTRKWPAPPKPRPTVLPWPPRLARDVDSVGPSRAFFATGSAATSSSESSASAAGLIWVRFRRQPVWTLFRRPTSRAHRRPSGGGWRWTHAAFGGHGRQREGKVTTRCAESPR